MRIDAHVHVWPPGTDVGARPEIAAAGTVDALAQALPSAGTNAVVLVQPAACGLDHSHLLAAARDPRLWAVAVAQVDPSDPRSADVVPGSSADPAIAGVRLPLLRAAPGWLAREGARYWEAAFSSRLVLEILAAPDQLGSLRQIVRAHPEVPVVLDHLARPDLAADPDAAIARLCALADLPNVHVKVSALGHVTGAAWPYRERWPWLHALVDSFGSERLLWGSDHPFSSEHGVYGSDAEAVVRALADGGDGAVADVLGRSARRLFFLDERRS